MKKHILLATLAAFAFTAPAFAADESYESTTKVKKSDSGDYDASTKTEGTDTTGTTTTNEKSVDVDVDSNGNTKKTVETKDSVDPKGLFNKQTTKTKDVSKMDANGAEKTTHEKTVNGHTVEDTTQTNQQ